MDGIGEQYVQYIWDEAVALRKTRAKEETMSFYPVLVVDSPEQAAQWFCKHLGFTRTYTDTWYVSMDHEAYGELAVLEAGHATLPVEIGKAAGVLLNVEVPDADALAAQLSAAGVEVVLGLRTEEWGQRHAIFRTPFGVLLDVITVTEPEGEYVDKYEEHA